MRRWLRQLFCRHSSVEIFRSHASCHTRQRGKEAWIDKWKVYNYVRCVKCGRFLTARKTEQLFGEQ